MVLIRLLTLRTLVHMQTISKNVRAGRTCNLSVHYFPASSPGPRGRAGDPLQRAAASLCSRHATCVPSAASCPRFAIRQRRDPTPTQASTRSQPKKKNMHGRSSSFRAPPPPWLALLVSPEFSSRVAGPPGAGLGRPLCVPVPVLATPCDDCVGRYKETVLAVTKIPYKKYNPLRYGLKPNEHVGD